MCKPVKLAMHMQSARTYSTIFDLASEKHIMEFHSNAILGP